MYPHHVFNLEPAGTFGMYPICYQWVSGRYFQPEPAMYSRCFHWFPDPLAPSVSTVLVHCIIDSLHSPSCQQSQLGTKTSNRWRVFIPSFLALIHPYMKCWMHVLPVSTSDLPRCKLPIAHIAQFLWKNPPPKVWHEWNTFLWNTGWLGGWRSQRYAVSPLCCKSLPFLCVSPFSLVLTHVELHPQNTSFVLCFHMPAPPDHYGHSHYPTHGLGPWQPYL